jgi:hypothetical protein
MNQQQRTVVQQALDALESCDQVYGSEGSYQYFSQAMVDKAITALRQLLEQPEPVPVQEQFDLKLLDDLKKLMGLPPYNESSNTAMGDGYFSAHLIRTHGKEKFDAAVAYLRSGATSTPPAQPADHSEQDLDMVENGDLLTIVYMDGLHTGKQIAKREWVGLTDEQANLLINGRGEHGDDDYVEPTGDGFGLTDEDLVKLIRRVEAHHGIGVKP